MNNIENIRNAFVENGLDGMLITSKINRFYATGFNSSAGILLITEKKTWFFIDSRYLEAAQDKLSDVEIQLVKSGESYFSQAKNVINENHINKLGFEEEIVTYSEYQTWKSDINADLIKSQTILKKLRKRKSKEEYHALIEAQRIAEKSFGEILPIISTKITEKDLASELIYRCLKNSAEDKSFDPIVVSGFRSSLPHGVPSDNLIQEGFLTIDFGVRKNGWCSDTTRTLSVGKPTDEMRKVYETVLAAQLTALASVKAGVECGEIDRTARQFISEAGYGEYFRHSFGHGVGLALNDWPYIRSGNSERLEEGDVFTAEPGIYIPGQFGVRIEDTLIVSKDGYENLTNISKQLIVID